MTRSSARPSRRVGLGEGEHVGGLPTGPDVPRAGLRVAGAVVVLGDQGGVLVLTAAAGADLREPAARQAVVALAVRPQHAVVGHVAQQRVLEEELAGGPNAETSRSKTSSRPRRSSRVSAVSPVSGEPSRCCTAWSQNTRPTTEARCSTARSGRAARPAAPGGRRAAWRARRPSRRARRPPATGSSLTTTPASMQPGDQLLDVERVALRRVDHQVGQRLGRCVHVLQDLQERAAGSAGATAERAPAGRGGPGPRPSAAGPRAAWAATVATTSTRRPGARRRRRRASASSRRRPSAGPRAASTTGATRREPGEVLGQRLGGPVAPGLRVRGQRAGGRSPRSSPSQAPTRWAAGAPRRLVVPGLREARLQLAAYGVGRVGLDDAEPAGDHVAQQRVRVVLPGVRGAAAEPVDGLGPLGQPGSRSRRAAGTCPRPPPRAP